MLSTLYNRYILGFPKVALLLVLLVVLFFGSHVPKFHLDASADSLVLEHDESLDYYRSIKARYGSDDYLVITYTPKDDLFDKAVLGDLKVLRDNLRGLSRVESVISILDVPLFNSAKEPETQKGIYTLDAPETSIFRAKKEFLNSPLYSDLLLSGNAKTTALLLTFKQDDMYQQLLGKRNQLAEKLLTQILSHAEQRQLAEVSTKFKIHAASFLKKESQDIATIRNYMAQHTNMAALHLGGVPMIVADSVSFIERDLLTFGVGVSCFLLLLLAISFKSVRWVIVPIITCIATGITMIGFLGVSGWAVTVVSSNFISLLLIITLSLTIHLIVCYRELQISLPDADQNALVKQMVANKVMPCFYTTVTTIVAFGSLLVSGIRPVIDFGWMMTIGISISFVFAFTLFPALLLLLGRAKNPQIEHDATSKITAYCARMIEHSGRAMLTIFAVVTCISIYGITLLTVENRFIDYYKETTEIYRGMELIDRELGGTTPLDIIIDQVPLNGVDGLDEVVDEYTANIAPITQGYWFNSFMLEDITAIHEYLDSLPESGKILSLNTLMAIAGSVGNQGEIDSFALALLHKELPDDIRETLFTPYISKDGNQIRFSMRVFESSPLLRRSLLLEKIRTHLVDEIGLENSQIHFTGMLVLYNNMLKSLFESQILTLSTVFLAIFVMFIWSFRNIKMATIAIISNSIAAVVVLGVMGLAHIPLDVMTITIAAICVGIAVDDTIHYVHRFIAEFAKDQNYWAAVKRSHKTIGRAMYYTTITITLGFSILVLSNFVPTMYFGLLTGFSMVVALLADLILLPLLIVKLKPLGR